MSESKFSNSSVCCFLTLNDKFKENFIKLFHNQSNTRCAISALETNNYM